MSATRIDDAAGFLIGTLGIRARSRPRWRRALSAISVILALVGAGMLSYPVITNIYSSNQQGKLAADFISPNLKARFDAGGVLDGQVLVRIVIPKIGVNALIVEGTDAGALRAGAGHYKGTAMPCTAGNTAIAGHRTTYGKPFNRIDELSVGDEIRLITPEKSCTYKVVAGPPGKPKPHQGSAGWVTTPNDGSVIGPTPSGALTLTTCHPKGSAAKRLIVRAESVAA
ncbi:MAG: sortase [Actinomycetota bacterium]|nr:sortase [Actinomycetota bacterium]